MIRHRHTNLQGRLVAFDGGPDAHYKSQLELKEFIRQRMDPDAAAVSLQDPRIRYVGADGKPHRYTGDVHVKWRDPQRRPLVIEVKPFRYLQRHPELEDKHRRIREVFATQGVDFVVHTEEDILTKGLDMMRFVFDYRNNPPGPVESAIKVVMRRHGELELGQLAAAVAGENSYAQALVVPFVWRLVAHHQLRVDYTVGPLDARTKIRMPFAA